MATGTTIKAGAFSATPAITANVPVCAITLIKAKKIPTWNKRVKIYVDPSTIASTDLFIEKSVHKKIKTNVKIMYTSGVKKAKPIKSFTIGPKITANNKKMAGKVILNNSPLLFLSNSSSADSLKPTFLCFVPQKARTIANATKNNQ